MAQAIVNPEDLRRFAARLKQFNNEMMTQLTTLHGQLSGLGQSWRDREHDKFVEEFEQRPWNRKRLKCQKEGKKGKEVSKDPVEPTKENTETSDDKHKDNPTPPE